MAGMLWSPRLKCERAPLPILTLTRVSDMMAWYHLGNSFGRFSWVLCPGYTELAVNHIVSLSKVNMFLFYSKTSSTLVDWFSIVWYRMLAKINLNFQIHPPFGAFDVCRHLLVSTEITVQLLSCMKQKVWHQSLPCPIPVFGRQYLKALWATSGLRAVVCSGLL